MEACAVYFDRKGWLPTSFASLSGPAMANGAYGTVLEFAKRIKEADPRIPILVPWFPQDLAPFGWTGYQVPPLEPFADVWLPPAQFFDAKEMAQERSRGRRTWFAADRPPFSGSTAFHADESTVRVLALQALQAGAQAVHLGCINPWPPSRTSSSPAACIQFDARTLIFPGKPFGWSEPVASVRLKHLRRSAQDAAYHALLRQHGLEHLSDTILDALAPYAGTAAYHTHYADGRPIGWPLDPSMFEVARQIMARELMEKTGPTPFAEEDTSPNRDALWRRLMTETRQFRAEVQGVRLRPQSGNETLEVEALLDLTNQRRTPVAGCIRATTLPEGWVANAATGCFPSLPPGGLKSTRARWSASTLQSNADGHVVLPLGVIMEEGRPQSLTAMLSFVVAKRPDQAIRIDGDLRDWSPGKQNVAGSFKLISRSAQEEDDREPSAQSKTFGFVARDEDSLYIALRCESKTKRESPAERTNRVVYEDMIPKGEELVEVLLDPLNTGVRSPEDLYHVVVKRSGIHLLEKGIRLDPPCGRCEPWTAQVEVASATRSDAWTVELRIPFAAFDIVNPTDSVWAFNITRFDLQHQEFSTWSGAHRNAYDPVSLGNLYFPAARTDTQTADSHR